MAEQTSNESGARLQRLMGFLGHDPGNLTLRRDTIRVALDAAQWSIVRSLTDEGLALHADDPVLLALSGHGYLGERRYQDAERTLVAALDAGVEPAEVRYNLAYALFMQRRYSDALS